MKAKADKKRKMKQIEEICCRRESQLIMARLLPFVVIGGYFCPRIGFTVDGFAPLTPIPGDTERRKDLLRFHP